MIEITKDNFEQEVMNSDKPVFLDFWAPWCGFCNQLMPTVEELSEDYLGKVKFGKINIDNEPELAAKFGVMSIPVTMVIEGGELKSKILGAFPKDELVAKHNL
ncbi:MAG: thioredoxin [Hornefia sp.]|nr:thioredoxin [Hornefia sp.]